MRLAWKNLCHDYLRFAVTIIGIAFAVILMIFEGSLLSGFYRAAARVVMASEAEIWIAARGVPSLECPAPVPERFRDLALGVPGVEQVNRITAGFTYWMKPNGSAQSVMLVGAEAGMGETFPVPRLHGSGSKQLPLTLLPEAVLIDRSNARLFDVKLPPQEIEIAEQRARVVQIVEGFGSFLGTPYIFTGYEDGLKYLGNQNRNPHFLTVRLARGVDIGQVQDQLRARLPEVDVWTREEFAARSQNYWLAQTGAGGAILLAAGLGFIVGLVIVSQTIYATTMENLEEFATLKAMGATRWFVRRVVILQAIFSGLIGCAVGLSVAFPLIRVAQGAIPWIFTPVWLPPLMLIVGLVMCSLASLLSVRKAISVEPGRVFRA